MVELPDPAPLAADEVLVEVRAAAVASWDEFVRTGGWDVGRKPPMALGVEASGTIAAVGDGVSDWRAGDEVLTHPLPLRGTGAWAPLLVAPAGELARKPAGASWEAAAAFPVPALTAAQVIDEALKLEPGQRILVHGAGGVTGGLMVAVAALRGGEVIATAGPASAERVKALGAAQVLDYHDESWPDQVQAEAAVNAVPGGSGDVGRAVVDGGRAATITPDAPPEERGIAVTAVIVRPDGDQLRELAPLLEQESIQPAVGATYALEEAAEAFAAALAGRAGGAVLLTP
jgi:NADPH:quinone reductase-like Zn-dependent oxidoreductase